MRIGLFGFGRAGKAVASVFLQSKEATLAWVVRRSETLQSRSAAEFLGIPSSDPSPICAQGNPHIACLLDDAPVDVIVDFSSADGIAYYGREASRRGIAVVTAVSSYPERTVTYLRNLAAHTRILWSPNITLGVNFLILASKLLRTIAPYTDVEVMEEHFRAKKEVSGTAKVIANTLGMDEQSIKSIRAGGIVGRHEVIFGFPYQTVRLIHESISREAFGNGALFAARRLLDKAAGLCTMEDLLLPYLMEMVNSQGTPAPSPAELAVPGSAIA